MPIEHFPLVLVKLVVWCQWLVHMFSQRKGKVNLVDVKLFSSIRLPIGERGQKKVRAEKTGVGESKENGLAVIVNISEDCCFTYSTPYLL